MEPIGSSNCPRPVAGAVGVIQRMPNPVCKSKHIRLLVDGREDCHSKALLVISALHLLARKVPIGVVNVLAATPNTVDVAAAAFAWDTGVAVEFFEAAECSAALSSSDIAIAVGFTMPPVEFETAARHAGKPTVIAVQFPELPAQADYISTRLAAHDTRVLAEEIMRAMPNFPTVSS